MEELLKQLKAYLARITQFMEAVQIFSWDLQTASPKEGAKSKIDSIGFFSTEIFKITTLDEFGDVLRNLAKPENFGRLDDAMKVTVKRLLRDFERSKRTPQEFFTEYVTTKAKAEQAWEQAKKACDFSIFEPLLDKVISMTKQYAAYIEPGKDPYDVLVDLYEEGMDTETIDSIFGEVKEGVLPLLKKIAARPKPDLSAIEGSYDIAAQKKVQRLLLDYIGFHFDRGSAGESAHPFTTKLCPGDVRVTNAYHEDDPVSAMFSAIHEGGHAIFEQNIDPIYDGTAVAVVDMMGLHESQSRFFENILGRNPNFWIPIYDQISGLLPRFKKVPFETFVQAICQVKPGPIRLKADEVTYCLHIILRYEIEKAIFRENAPTMSLPQLWNAKTRELLGVTPANDCEGILQDIHWSNGSFGYFPSYLLGSIYDGMFLEAAQRELGSLDSILREGRIKEITSWLNNKIHRYGSLYDSKEALKRVCGKELSAKPLLRYFKDKYERDPEPMLFY